MANNAVPVRHPHNGTICPSDGRNCLADHHAPRHSKPWWAVPWTGAEDDYVPQHRASSPADAPSRVRRGFGTFSYSTTMIRPVTR